MKKLLLPFVAAAGIFSAAVQAEQIDYFTGAGTVFLSNGTTAVPSPNIVWMGFFATGFNFVTNTSFAQLSAGFTLIDTVQFGQDESGLAGGGAIVAAPPGQFYGSIFGSPLPGSPPANQQLYIWVFNSANPAVSTPSQWAILTNPVWTRPASGPNQILIDPTSDAGTIVPAGAIGSLVANGGGFNIVEGNAPAIPEPSTYAMGVFGLAAVAAFRRRRATKA